MAQTEVEFLRELVEMQRIEIDGLKNKVIEMQEAHRVEMKSRWQAHANIVAGLMQRLEAQEPKTLVLTAEVTALEESGERPSPQETNQQEQNDADDMEFEELPISDSCLPISRPTGDDMEITNIMEDSMELPRISSIINVTSWSSMDEREMFNQDMEIEELPISDSCLPISRPTGDDMEITNIMEDSMELPRMSSIINVTSWSSMDEQEMFNQESPMINSAISMDRNSSPLIPSPTEREDPT